MFSRKLILVVVPVLLVASGQCHAQAQNPERTAEAGFHFTSINLRPFNSTEGGGGVRLSYNINEYLAVEAEGNIFEFSIGDQPTDDVLAAQGLLGVKAGWRNRRVGVFAKFRPGVVNFPSLKGPRRLCSVLPCEGSRRSGNRFAIDAGGVLEVYPTEKLILRFDLGDTMIRFGDDSFFESSTQVGIKDGFSHSFQFGVGVGFRF